MKHSGVFVSSSGNLADRPGGAQQCTREYIATLRAAGIEMHFCPYELDKRLSTRVMRKLWPSSYFRLAEQALVGRIQAIVKRSNAKFVFLNQVQLASIAAPLRGFLQPDCRIVALSHGLESTDLLHTLRFKSDLPLALPRYFLGKQLLGDTLLRENCYRSNIDLILCLSPFDVELERWLGARRVEWLPRSITSAPLSWKPRGSCMGFVGTLDHAPNIEGLLVFLRSLSTKAPAGIRMRVVGGPDYIGRLLMKRFPIVDYLGALPDDELREEASTWNCFVHPIFCYPRGCSTKLATAIGWQIPIVTTTPGRRGYDWSQGALLIGDSPDKFSDLCLRMMNFQLAQQARAQVSDVAQSSPTIASIGRKLASLLEVH